MNFCWHGIFISMKQMKRMKHLSVKAGALATGDAAAAS
jgi:hypothetical protein